MFLGDLYDIQKPAANFLCVKERAILSWEQGTGKTVIAIAAAEKLRELNKASKVLVIAPSHICWQWADKIGEFSDESFSVVESKKRSTRTYGADVPWTITSYALFRKDFETIFTKPWDIIICDEAQEFKNNKSKTAKLLKELNREVNPAYKWALTGTVISNKLEELYSIMYWVDKRFFPAWPEFEKRHIVRHPTTNQILKYKNLTTVAESLPKRMDRKTQKDLAGQMPKLVEQFIYLEKDKELRNAEHILADALRDSRPDNILTSFDPDISRALHGVRQALVSEKKQEEAVRLVEKVLTENFSNRIVIFSYYKEPLYQLRTRITNETTFFSFLYTGDQTSDQKRDAVKAFKESQSVLLSSNAGKAGLDLPFANYIIHLDIPFSWEVLDQRNKRITRASSEFDTAKAIYLVVKHSIEEYYYQLVKQKGKLADAIYSVSDDQIVMRPQSLIGFLNESRSKN